jgi:hypothetical protein
MSVFPRRPEQSIPLTEAGPGVPKADSWLVRPRLSRTSHYPSPRERLFLARYALLAAGKLLRASRERALGEVGRARHEVHTVLSCRGDDLVETLMLVEDDLARAGPAGRPSGPGPELYSARAPC